jgi:hypothetical protein
MPVMKKSLQNYFSFKSLDQKVEKEKTLNTKAKVGKGFRHSI